MVDLGLRLEDVAGLEDEDVYIQSPAKARANLQENGASAAEIEFLLERRVELNAFASDELIAWLERKLQEHGVAKVIPDAAMLADAYARMRKQALVQERVNAALATFAGHTEPPPASLAARIAKRLKADPALRWDAVVREIAEADHKKGRQAMTRTDKKRRRIAMAIGESFAAIRRRTARSAAWLSLGGPAIKIYVELRLRWRHKDGSNNGQLFCSLRECEELLGIGRPTAVRAYAELEAKRFIVRTRQGEAGRLPASGTAANGGTGYSRKATLWALTDEPLNGQPATYAFEKLTTHDLKQIDRELHERFRDSAARPKNSFMCSPDVPIRVHRAYPKNGLWVRRAYP